MDDLEARLSAYYRSVTPGDSLALSSRAIRSIASARATSAISRRRIRFVPAIGGAGWVAAVVVVVSIVFGLSSGSFGPQPGEATSAPSHYTLPGGYLDSSIQAMGTIRSGGFWAIRNGLFLVTTDYASWHSTTLPSATADFDLLHPAVAVLDPDHAWLAFTAPSESSGAGSSASGGEKNRLSIARTTDGGKTWQLVDLPCEPRYADVGLAFADLQHGFVIALNPSGASSTVFRTEDGGATWTVASTTARTPLGPLGRQLSASDEETVWVAADAENTDSRQTLVAVSRDGGATWSDAPLPGTSGTHVGSQTPPPTAPRFFDADNGVFAVFQEGGTGTGSDTSIWGAPRDPGTRLAIYTTHDAGRTWSWACGRAAWPEVRFSPVTRQHWVVTDGWTLVTTDDAGGHWAELEMEGISQPYIFLATVFSDPLHGASWTVEMGRYPLFTTADGGKTWSLAQFGSALAVPSAPASQNEAAVRRLVDDFETYRAKGDGRPVWGELSPWSQRQFGSIDAFEAWQKALNSQGWYDDQVTGVVAGLSNWPAAPADLVADLTANGDVARAYVVTAVHAKLAGTPEANETFIVAPIKGGDWKIWLPKPTSQPAPRPTASP